MFFRQNPSTPWYYVEVLVGNPPQKLKLRLEGRGSTWVPWLPRIDDLSDCSRRYPSEDFGSMCKYANISGLYHTQLSNKFANITNSPTLSINYTTSETRGVFAKDDFQLNQLTVSNFTFGLAFNFQTSPALGVGIPEDRAAYPYDSYLQVLQSQGTINSLVYSLYLGDLRSVGDIYFGAIDQTKFVGDLQRFSNIGNDGMESHIPVGGVWWSYKNSSITSLITPNRDEGKYAAIGQVSFGATSLGVPKSIFDSIKWRFPLHENGGVWWLDCSSDIDIGSLNFAISDRLYNISSRQLFSNENWDGNKCQRFLAIDVLDEDASDTTGRMTPVFLLGDPFLRGAYAIFDFTNKQTLLAPAFMNATGSSVVVVGANDGVVQGTGHKLTSFYRTLPPIIDLDSVAPGTPTQPASDPSQSKAIIAGGTLGGIVVLILMLGAVYAIRPRSQRTRDFKTWFTFTKPRKSSPEPTIAYPPSSHSNRYYGSRIQPRSHAPGAPDLPEPVHPDGSAGELIDNNDITPVNGTADQSYYASTAYRPARLSNVEEAMEMAAPNPSSSRYQHPQFDQQANRYAKRSID
ncbi:hypothetical protein H072_3752 [Dactylellina haptotyla CBS 200.50]|uniref:Peptidase A1 domain-containing protein n=1 Tax=Dactylellina haptotyla (strain CBS 200.50) TaxID=1284197 RepID=S8AGU8_DACHA|nr:hypothetical protein H072_3752 [Dactylellina haptotyla CBS 200.50]